MELYFDATVGYNEFEQSIQLIEFSFILEDDTGKAIHEVHHIFDPIYGMDSNLLRWLGKDAPLKGSSNWRETLEEEIQSVLLLIDRNIKIVMWNDFSNYLLSIPYKNYSFVKNLFEDTQSLKRVAKKVLNIDDLQQDSKTRVRATRDIYHMIKDARNAKEE